MFSLLTKLSVCFWKILYGYKKTWNVICLIKTTAECPPILFEDCCICKTFKKKKYCKQTLSFTVGDEVKAHEHVQILIYLNGEKTDNQTDSSIQTYYLFFMTTYWTHKIGFKNSSK